MNIIQQFTNQQELKSDRKLHWKPPVIWVLHLGNSRLSIKE